MLSAVSLKFFATPGQLAFSQFDDITTGHWIIFINKVVGGAHQVILSYAGHPRIFVLHVQLCWFLFRIRIYSFPRKDGILLTEWERCWNGHHHTLLFGPTESKCPQSGVPDFPGASSSGPVGGNLWLTVIFQAFPLPPAISMCPNVLRQPPRILLLLSCFPPCQLSLDFLWIHACFLNMFLVPFHLLLPLLSDIFRRNEASFFLRVESLGSPLC